MQKRNLFSRSLGELKHVRCLAIAAIFIAINIALDQLGLTVRLSADLRISFGFLTNAAIGMLFGPVVGIMAGISTDVLGYFIGGNAAMGAYFPGYTLTAAVGGLIWGLWLYPRKVTVWRVIGAKACINLVCNIGLNTFWLTLTSGDAMRVLLATRVPKNLLLLPIEVALLYFFMRQVERIDRALPAQAGKAATARE